MRGPFARKRDGTIEVVLSDVEAGALRNVAGDFIEALGAPDDDMRRLFPPGYAADPEHERQFQEMTRDDLSARKRANARAVIDSLDAGTSKGGAWRGRFDDEGAHAWLGMLNDARLVLGTRIDVTEDMEHMPLPATDPAAPEHNMYLYLTALEGALIEELAEGLPTRNAG
jgi:hypothetical protein